MMQKISLVSLILFLTIACSNTNEAKYSEVLRIHDELMKKMSEVSNFKAKLQSRLADIKKDSTKSAYGKNIEMAIGKLQKSNADMMNWMRNFNSSYDTLPKDSSIVYLDNEKIKILNVRTEMEEAINMAKNFIE